MPYIVRVERGTINRGIYDIAVLFNPTAPAWTALAPQAQWNGKVVYSYGASTGQPRQQFRTEQNWADDTALARGFMTVDHSLTDSLFNSNRTLAAETTMMMKEHIADNYGEIRYTMGNGCSGGSIGQNTVSSIYPGLLDGIQPSCDFPDSITTGIEVTDCVLLVNVYNNPAMAALWTGLPQAQIDAKKAAIEGHRDQTGCQGWNNAFGFNNKPGNYVWNYVVNTNGALGAARRLGQPLQPAGRAGLRPGDEPDRDALRRSRPGRVGLGNDDRAPRRRKQTRALDQRQRRRAVRPEGARRRDDHSRGVRDAEREDRRHRPRFEPRQRPARSPTPPP